MSNEKTLKSVHITNYYHKNSGGISTAYNRLLEAANRHKRYVRLIVPGENEAVEEVGEYGQIYYVKSTQSPLFDKRYRIMLPWNTYLFDDAPIKKILRKEQPDIIEIGEKYTLSLMAGLLRRGILNVSTVRPMLVHFSCERMDDNIETFVSSGRIGKWFAQRYMGNYIFPMFDFHIANSKYTAAEFFDAVTPAQNPRRSGRVFNFCWRFFRAAQVLVKDRIFVNQCGSDNKIFNVERKNPVTRQSILMEAGFPENAKIVFYAGRISPEKNVKLFPSLMQSLSKYSEDYHLLIAGDGPKAEVLKKELQLAAPGKFKFLGHVMDQEKLADIYANTDVFVHPNPREPFGIAPLEAMSSGLPVVAPNSGGLLSYASNENAWLVEPQAAYFAAAIKEIFDDEEQREKKVKKALATAERFTWESSTDSQFALYDQMHADFLLRQMSYNYKKSPNKVNFMSRFISDYEKFSPAGLFLTIRCCTTRMQIFACGLYFFTVFASIAFVLGRRFFLKA